MIRKSGSKYVVYSESGRRLSKPMSHAAAAKRLAQIEYWKTKKHYKK